MPRLRRAEVFDPSEIAVVHVMSRVGRGCQLLGDDPISGKNFDHRKGWVVRELRRAAAWFGIDLIAFALMSNHLHLVLRSRPDIVQTWDDSEVAKRWLMICPKRKNVDGSPKEPSEPELNSIRHDATKVAEIRRRLSDISWWMRLMCQRIAQRANFEEQEVGKFWQNRYKAVRLLDEESILACAVYVDLNPIRAALAETLEDSSFTSAQHRIRAIQLELLESEGSCAIETSAPNQPSAPDAFLSPVQIATSIGNGNAVDRSAAECEPSVVAQMEGMNAPMFALPSESGKRCSDKGFASISAAEYLQLLDWTARQIVPGKIGSTPTETPPIFDRLNISVNAWCELTKHFDEYFMLVAGRPEHVDNYRSRLVGQRFNLRSSTRELLSQ